MDQKQNDKINEVLAFLRKVSVSDDVSSEDREEAFGTHAALRVAFLKEGGVVYQERVFVSREEQEANHV